MVSGDPYLFATIGELYVQTKLQREQLAEKDERIKELEAEKPKEA